MGVSTNNSQSRRMTPPHAQRRGSIKGQSLVHQKSVTISQPMQPALYACISGVHRKVPATVYLLDSVLFRFNGNYSAAEPPPTRGESTRDLQISADFSTVPHERGAGFQENHKREEGTGCRPSFVPGHNVHTAHATWARTRQCEGAD